MVRVFLPFKDMYMMHKKSKQVKDSIFQNGGKKASLCSFLLLFTPLLRNIHFILKEK